MDNVADASSRARADPPATIAGLYLRPFGARDWHVALAGGCAAWIAGPLGFREGLAAVRDAWTIEAFFLGLMLLAAGAEASGLYARLAATLVRAPRGRARLIAVLGVGIAITAVFSNDATPLILTPAVFALGMGEGEVAAAAFGVTFMADGASLILPASNPVNLLFYERFDLGFGHYAAQILPAAVAGALVLALVYGARRRPVLDRATGVPVGRAGVQNAHPGVSLFALALVPLLGGAYVGAAIAGVPLGLVTLVGGLFLLCAELVAGHFDVAHYRRHVSLGLLVFVASLLVLAESVSASGALDGLGSILGNLGDQPSLVAIAGSAAIAAILSNLLNNWPAALLLAVALDGISGGSRGPLITGTLIGCTTGANFTVVGSLSTVFWLSLTRAQGAVYPPGGYARRAALPTLAAVGAACVVAAMVS